MKFWAILSVVDESVPVALMPIAAIAMIIQATAGIIEKIVALISSSHPLDDRVCHPEI